MEPSARYNTGILMAQHFGAYARRLVVEHGAIVGTGVGALFMIAAAAAMVVIFVAAVVVYRRRRLPELSSSRPPYYELTPVHDGRAKDPVLGDDDDEESEMV